MDRPTFSQALSALVQEYLDATADAETICCDLYSMADALGYELIPDRLLPDDYSIGRADSGEWLVMGPMAATSKE